MWELDYKDRWAPKNLCFWTVLLGKTVVSPLDCKEIQPVHPKRNQSWIFIGRIDAEAETPILSPLDAKSSQSFPLKRLWCWERLRAGGEGNDRGWDGWIASRTQWTWVWVNFGSWWWTGRPGVLWFMGSQRVGHNWAAELNWYHVIGASEDSKMSKTRFTLILSYMNDFCCDSYWWAELLKQYCMASEMKGHLAFIDYIEIFWYL